MNDAGRLRAEHITVGETIALGEYEVTKEEILGFARQWDPQPFHIDEIFAAKHDFGELIASGLHTMGVYQRLAVLGAYTRWDIIAGRAIRDVQLTLPVRPDTVLRGEIKVKAVNMVDPLRALLTTTGTLYIADQPAFRVTADAYVARLAHSRGTPSTADEQ